MSKIIANYIAAWTKIVDFKGRSSRSEYWYATLGCIIVSLVLISVVSAIGMIASAVGADFITSIANTIYNVYYLASSLAFVSLGVRRLHDLGITGWLHLIILTGIGSIVLIVMFCLKGQPGINKYGVNPAER